MRCSVSEEGAKAESHLLALLAGAAAAAPGLPGQAMRSATRHPVGPPGGRRPDQAPRSPTVQTPASSAAAAAAVDSSAVAHYELGSHPATLVQRQKILALCCLASPCESWLRHSMPAHHHTQSSFV